MVRVSTFCPRCGESIETDVPDEARLSGRASLACPACRFDFVIAPAKGASAQADAPRPATPMVGEPVRASGAARVTGPARISFKPLAAGMMLLFVAVIGLWMGSVLVFTDDLVASGFADMEGTGDFAGRVTGPDDAPIAGVQVSTTHGPDGLAIDAVDRVNVTTGPDGRYRFTDLAAGVYTFRFTHPNQTAVVLQAPVYPDSYASLFSGGSAFGNVEMPAPGGTEAKQVSRIDELQSAGRVAGWIILVLSALALAGGWACIRRKAFPLAVVGAVAGIFTFGFIVGSIVSALALILILMSRKEFPRKAQTNG